MGFGVKGLVECKSDRNCQYLVSGKGFRVSRFELQSLTLKRSGLEGLVFRSWWNLEFDVLESVFRVSGLGLRVWGLVRRGGTPENQDLGFGAWSFGVKTMVEGSAAAVEGLRLGSRDCGAGFRK